MRITDDALARTSWISWALIAAIALGVALSQCGCGAIKYERGNRPDVPHSKSSNPVVVGCPPGTRLAFEHRGPYLYGRYACE